MLHVIGTYLGVVGGVAAGAQVARGACAAPPAWLAVTRAARSSRWPAE